MYAVLAWNMITFIECLYDTAKEYSAQNEETNYYHVVTLQSYRRKNLGKISGASTCLQVDRFLHPNSFH